MPSLRPIRQTALAAALILPGLALPLPAQEGGAASGTDGGAAAQPGTGAAPSGLSLGEPASDIGTEYTASTFESWEVRCVKTENGKDPCQLYQLLKDGQGTSVAEISIIPLPKGQQAVAGATIVTPLETLLTEQVTLAIDGAKAKRYPFTFCAAVGCISRVGFTDEEVAAFRKGSKAVLTIAPLAAPDKKVSLDISLKGFTAGFKDVVERSEANAAKK